ncbi:MAG: flippase, partial [Chloroflexota bacterium]
YLPAVPVLQIVIWAVPLMFASEFLGYMVVVQGKESRVARAVLLSTSLNVALNILLIPRFGFIAAAIMTVLTEAVLVGQYLWFLRG